MEDKKVTVNKGGVGFCGLLTIVFIVLKLTGTITWSWVWVLCPLWIPWGLVLVSLIIALICVEIAALVERWR